MAELFPPRRPHSLVVFLVLVLVLCSAPPRPSSLAQQPPLPYSDLAALRTLKDSLTDLPGSSFFSTWDFSSVGPCLSFSGLTCSPFDGRVTILSLGDSSSTGRGLAGFLPISLSSLSSLTQLLLSPGIVTGPIPPQLGLLHELRILSLPHNRLTGPIPASLSSLPNLHTLDLSFNQLSGSVPAGLPSVLTLKVLVLANNLLSGSLPQVSTPLLHLDLSRNLLTSGIPPQLPSSLRYLSLSQNLMWGTIDRLESLSDLAYLDLSLNRFDGPVPASLFRPSLSTMLLGRNNFSGGIPPAAVVGSPDLEPYGPGSVVDLSHNCLTGKLTAVLAGVESLFLNNNHLTGAVLAEYVESLYQGRTRTLFLQHNYLTSFPLANGAALPEGAALCLSYNCMVPPVGLEGCPARAGDQLSRPPLQCSANGHGG